MDRIKKIKSIRDKLESGEPTIGSWMQIPHASIAEIMGDAGYDWVAVDMEHGSISDHQLPDLFRALELGGTLPLARVAEGSIKDCKRALDAGAGGIVVPMIESREQLERVVEACQWPPAGKRGVGFSRANLFGKNFDNYREEAQAPLVVAMIENINAVKNLNEILRVKGLDAILIGSYDLSASMGITAEFESAEFKKAMEEILTFAGKSNIPCGIHIVKPDPIELKTKINSGYRFIAYSIDSVFLNYSVMAPEYK